MVLSTPAPQGQCIRLANIDYYLSNRPTPWDLPAVHPDLLSGTPQQVPVVRVFGRLASTNQVACLHIHRVWPYLYFPLTSSEPVTVAARRRILAALNAALATAVGRSTWQASQSPLVAGLELVRGTPFYGHRFGEQHFWKLYYINPAHGSTLAALLQKGAALGTPCEVYEAHIPYVLQFMVDFNLYGMRWIHVERSKERPPGSLDPEFATIGLDHAQPMGSTERLTWCQIELDTLAAHIGNRRSVGARYIHARVDGAAPPSPVSHAKFVPSLAAIEALVHGFVRDLISSPSASTPSHPGQSVTPRPCSTAKATATHEPAPKTEWGMHARLLDQLQAVLRADSYQAETADNHLPLSSEELGRLCHPRVDLLPAERTELFDQLRQHWETFPTNLLEPSASQATAPQGLSSPVTTAFESLFLASDVAEEHDLVSRPPSRMASFDTAWQLDLGAIKGLQSPFESPYRRPTKAPSPGAQATQVATPTEHPTELDALEHQMSQLCAALEHHPDVELAVEEEEEEAEGEGASDGNRGQQLDDFSADDEEVWEALRDIGQTEEGGDLGLTYRSGTSGSEGSTEESNNDDFDAVMNMPEPPARGQPAGDFPESLLSQPPFEETTPRALDIPQVDGADDDEDEDGETDMDYTFPDSDRSDARTSRTRVRAGHPPRLRRTMLQFSRQPLTPKPGISSSRQQVVARAVSVQRKEVAAPRSLASEHGRDPIEPATPNHRYTPAKRNASFAPLSAIRPLQFTNSRRVKREAVRRDPSLNRDNTTGEDLVLPRKRRSTDRTAETSTATRWGHPTVIRTLQPLAYAGPAATHLTPTARAQPQLNIPTQTGDERYQSAVDEYDPLTAPQLSEEFNCIPFSPGELSEIPAISGHRYQMTAPVNSPAPHARDSVRLSQPPLPMPYPSPGRPTLTTADAEKGPYGYGEPHPPDSPPLWVTPAEPCRPNHDDDEPLSTPHRPAGPPARITADRPLTLHSLFDTPIAQLASPRKHRPTTGQARARQGGSGSPKSGLTKQGSVGLFSSASKSNLPVVTPGLRFSAPATPTPAQRRLPSALVPLCPPSQVGGMTVSSQFSASPEPDPLQTIQSEALDWEDEVPSQRSTNQVTSATPSSPMVKVTFPLPSDAMATDLIGCRNSYEPSLSGTLVYRYRKLPPTADALQGSLRDYGLLQAPYPPPLPADPPVRAAHSRFDPGFRHWTTATKPPSPRSVCAWLNKNPLVPVPPATPTPPARAHQARPAPAIPMVNPAVVSQIEGPLPFLAEAFKISQRYSTPTAGEHSVLLSVLSLEIHVNTRGELLPDPLHDPVTAIFCSLWLPVDEADDTHPPATSGTHVAPPVKSNPCFVLYHEPTSSVSDQASPDKDSPRRNDRQAAILTACRRASRQVQIIVLDSERALLETLITLVTHAWDPDVLSGYELQNSSWGYLVERCSTVYQVDLGLELSRLRPPEGVGPPLPRPSASHSPGNPDRNAAAEYLMRKASSLQVPGRHVLNLWRVLRNRCALNIYTFENVVYHFLHHRSPYFDPATLTQWYTDGPDLLRGRAFEYHLERTLLNNRLLDASDALHQASEFAGIYGVDFFSVLTRGSQYKVEAMMLRVAKPENLLLLSPSKERVAQQRATECLPLVMEPRSDVYRSPVLVLDFQSLYPSLMIAYNYCYSTCLGTVRTPGTRRAIGATQIELPQGLVSTLVRHNQLQIAPNGVMYVKSDVRRSLLARLLSEILDTRVMIKRRMADLQRVLQGLQADASTSTPAASRLRTRLRKLEAFQMALKMIANVTYGYVGASYSGRMPCADVADSIVQTGRETLERTIATINSHPTWGSQVVYGDTDSVFVHLPGASRDRAFDVGEEIARTITQMNPAPVKLKFEKVYQPCVLLAKKRYTGFKYEYRGQTEPVFEGKGTETVRRDGCPATQKMMEKCLRLLFTTNDLSVVRGYLHREWSKIMVGRVNVQDFLFAKEVRLGKYSLGGTHLPPPGVIVALKRMARDPRQAPQYGERVPYIVAYGGPQDRLADQILDPREFLAQSHLRLHGRYYVLKQIIPPLNRVFTLIGVDLHLWFAAMPRTSHEDRRAMSVRNASKAAGAPQRALVAQATLHHYFDSGACVACAAPARQELCVTCQTSPPSTAYVLLRKLRQVERRFDYLTKACQGCTGLSRAALRPGHGGPLVCASLDCPLYFDNVKCCADLLAGDTYADALSLLEF